MENSTDLNALRKDSLLESPNGCKAEAPGENNRGPHGIKNQFHGVQWWETFFDLTYAGLDLDSIGIEQTRREVDFMIDVLDLNKHQGIVDIGSGLGRHVLEFARRGFKHVTGLDQSPILTEESRARAELENLAPRFITGDARGLPYSGEFERAYIWMNLLGYFEDPADDARILASAARALKPGGKLLLDIIHRDWVIRNFSSNGWKRVNNEYILEDRTFDLITSTVYSSWTMITHTGTYHRQMRLRLYSLNELIGMFSQSGLRFEDAWANLDKVPATFDAYHLKILAIKE
ncbi:class I SAM-dependent methyltransferase [bacterium]|nr:class I SAM-dependent methyltransferase [bacterium]